MKIYRDKATVKIENQVIEKKIKNQHISLPVIRKGKKVLIQYQIEVPHGIFKGTYIHKTHFQYSLSESREAVRYEEESNDSFIKLIKNHAK